MSNIFITSEYFSKFSPKGKEILEKAGHRVIDNPYGHKFLSPEEIIPYVKEADALICDLEKINRQVIDAAPNLKIISRRGVGVDSVDVDYAKQKGIEVARTLGVVEPPVAELVFSYILAFSRRVCELSADMHRGVWEKLPCHSVDGKILGIVGMGKIAYETARRAHAFGMKILYCDLVENSRVQEDFGAVRVTLDEVLNQADFVTLHLPLTQDTEGLFDYATISKMKPTAYLINTARGAIIREADLLRALEEKKIGGAAIDVFDTEPQENSPLRPFSNVILTPHVGTFTQEIFIQMDIVAAENIIRYFNK